MALPRDRRITTRREIQRLLTGSRARGEALELYWRPAAGPRARATCVTPKHGRSSVERNRLRRRLQDLLREILLARDEPRDWLVRSRAPAYGLTFDELRAALRSLAPAAAEAGPADIASRPTREED